MYFEKRKMFHANQEKFSCCKIQVNNYDLVLVHVFTSKGNFRQCVAKHIIYLHVS